MSDGTSINDDDPSDESDVALERRLAPLREEHKDLDDAIRALEERPQPDMLQIARLKKKKLALKDQIGRLEDQLMPDIIA
jgi:hypothetical protein